MPLDLPDHAWPRHIAVIMDGNGRWAERQGLLRAQGHDAGARTLHRITEVCTNLGRIEQLTPYCLSSENWKRPREEVDFLMHLLEWYVVEERPTFMANNVRVRFLGRREGIPPQVLDKMDETVAMTGANTGMWLNLAVNYGGRAELVDAMRSLARDVAAGDLEPDAIDEATIGARLTTAGAADPDLVIRTAGELRVSNFLLWQISYAEIWVTPKCWPDFAEEDLHAAIADYARRTRRFGGLAS